MQEHNKRIGSCPLFLSVVIPVYNEERSLSELIERIVQSCQLYESYEIICVDDGSTDASFEILCGLNEQYPQLIIIKFKENAGQSAALAAGFKAAQGEIIVSMDADLQNPPEAIPLLLKNMDGVDAVIGWRKDRQDPFITRAGSRIANFIRRVILQDPFHDNGCALKVFRRYVVCDLLMFKNVVIFLPNLIHLAGYRIREIPIPHNIRKYGQSKNRMFSFSGVVAFFDIFFLLGFRKRRIKYTIDKVIS